MLVFCLLQAFLKHNLDPSTYFSPGITSRVALLGNSEAHVAGLWRGCVSTDMENELTSVSDSVSYALYWQWVGGRCDQVAPYTEHLQYTIAVGEVRIPTWFTLLMITETGPYTYHNIALVTSVVAFKTDISF